MADTLPAGLNIAGSVLFHIMRRCFGCFLEFCFWVCRAHLTRRFSGVAMLTALSLARVLSRWTCPRRFPIPLGLVARWFISAVRRAMGCSGCLSRVLRGAGHWFARSVCPLECLGRISSGSREVKSVLRMRWSGIVAPYLHLRVRRRLSQLVLLQAFVMRWNVGSWIREFALLMRRGGKAVRITAWSELGRSERRRGTGNLGLVVSAWGYGCGWPLFSFRSR